MTRHCPECGTVLERPRSTPQHRRFFGLIAAAFHHWPEGQTFQPDTPEHLRAWLLCKCEYRDVTHIESEMFTTPETAKLAALAMEQAIKAAGSYGFVRPHRGSLAVISAKSIAFDKLTHKKFQPIADAIEQEIENILGVSGDELLNQHKRAA